MRYQRPPIGQSDRLQDEKGNPLCSIKGCLKIHADVAENNPDYPLALELGGYNKEAKEHRDKEWARLEQEAKKHMGKQAWTDSNDPWMGGGK